MRDYPYAEIIHCAIILLDTFRGASACEVAEIVQVQRRNGSAWVDWSIDICRRMPEDKRMKGQIIDYARGAGNETRVVKRFISCVPEQLWIDGERIAGKVY